MRRYCCFCGILMGCYSGIEKLDCGGSFCTGICPPKDDKASHGVCGHCLKKHFEEKRKDENLCVL